VKSAARVVALLGAIGLGWLLLERGIRDVVLVYDVAAVPDATSLEVDLRNQSGVVRHARMVVRKGEQIRHPVRLRDGSYVLAWRLERPGAPLTGERPLEVHEDEQVVLALGP
jgi:hypothetical protein